jgi:hypothetical protein
MTWERVRPPSVKGPSDAVHVGSLHFKGANLCAPSDRKVYVAVATKLALVAHGLVKTGTDYHALSEEAIEVDEPRPGRICTLINFISV